jgi:tRNA G18 (ribose-2'-O)-methylase SpoU
MNVIDSLKNSSIEDVKKYCVDSAIDAAAAMMHVTGDFNLSTMVRNANFFGFRETVYVGGTKKWDRRGAVGTQNYTPVKYIKTEEDFVNYCVDNNYMLISVENNIPEYSHKTIGLYDDDRFLSKINNPMFIFGEEKSGLSKFMLDSSELIVTIPSYGSVRSLNVGTVSGIIMSHFRSCNKK